MANTLVLRLKAKNGNHVLRQLTSESTFQDLKEAVSKLTDMPVHTMKLLAGYPPKPLVTAKSEDTLNHLHIKSGETLMVEEDPKLKAARQKEHSQNLLKVVESQINSPSGILTRHVVPANNSCLFTSINFVMEGGVLELSCAPALREIIAGVVMSDPDMYNEAFLGKDNAAYCEWILRDDNWGGAIEVSIMSKYYQKEICVVDTQTCRIDRFGEDQNYKTRVLVIYDGIHYDPLAMESLDGSGHLKTTFSTDNFNVLQQALELASEAKASRQFTDVANFTLRCLVCSKALKGESEAQHHAKQTGHINFGEV